MLDVEKGGDAVSGHTGDRTIVFRRREPARGEGSGAAGVSCSAMGWLPETRWPDHLHGGRGEKHPDVHARSTRRCRSSAYLKEKERERRFVVPVEVVRAARAAHRILLSATAPGCSLISVGPSSAICNAF